MFKKIILINFILVISNNFNYISAKDLEHIVEKIQTRYETIDTFSGNFVQKSYRSNSLTDFIEAGGEISYMKPGKMKWEYDYPEKQLLVTNGNKLWLYDEILENVTIKKLSSVTKGTILDFLIGIGDLTKDFTPRQISKKLITQSKGIVIELVPKEKLANLEFIQIEADSFSFNLKTILLMDFQNNYRKISFKNITYNIKLDKNVFNFFVSKDMEVIYVN